MQVKAIPRIETGVPRLDFLLKGGFFEGGLYVIKGQPGMGKTILANQFCFHRSHKKENAVYISMLAESTGRMVSYLSSLEFVDQDAIGQTVHYVSGYQAFKDSNLTGFRDFIRALIQEHKAKVLILDGLDIIRSANATENEYREFLHSLQAYASLSKCTTLLLIPLAGESNKSNLEHALSDGVIEISEWRSGPRSIREIQVLKLRGSDFLKGGHEIEITSQGFLIHPRTEVQFAKPSAGNFNEERTRMGFGIEELDRMLHGGILSGSLTTLFGTPGTGKTTLGLSFLVEGAQRGEHGIYFGFYEAPPRLLEKAQNLGLDLQKYVDQGLIQLQWQASVENIPDALAERLLEGIREKGKTKVRVFIDGMSGFRRAMAYSDRFGSFLAALSHELRTIGATTLFSEESEFFSSDPELPNRELGSVVDNVIFLRYIELSSRLRRLFSILKMRESAYSPDIREFVIGDKGIEIIDSFENSHSVLTGHPQPIEKAKKKMTKKASSAKRPAKKSRTK